ncbi:MAG: type II toxin-antitoxin system HicA family toxin [Mucinivorans sp.]
MSADEKLIERFKKQPKNFTFNEMVRLFAMFGFVMNTKGNTSGSRMEFVNAEKNISYSLHKPHPQKEIKSYVMKQVLEYFICNDLITK